MFSHVKTGLCFKDVQSPKVFGFADLIVVLFLFPLKQVTVWPYVERPAVWKESRANLDFSVCV